MFFKDLWIWLQYRHILFDVSFVSANVVALLAVIFAFTLSNNASNESSSFGTEATFGKTNEW